MADTSQNDMPSLRQAIEDIRRAALAVDRYHARWGAHGAIDPSTVFQAAAAAPGPYELLRPDEKQWPTAAASARACWSPQRRAGEPVSRSDDIYALGLAVVERVEAALANQTFSPTGSAKLTRRLDELRAAATAWSPSGRPASGAELVALVERVAEAARASAGRVGEGHAIVTDACPSTARRLAMARRAHRLAQTLPPEMHQRRPREIMRVRAPLGKGRYPDLPLPTAWVAVLVAMLCSVYLLPLYFMLFSGG